ncbi:hypothetical protein ACFO3I_05055 [Rheinheimera marina]|uniref:Lipoprotein n=1 Tax=Rheinheimera marina TaxID=1774958 RepID=A0ABV9JJT1_9GAMM
MKKYPLFLMLALSSVAAITACSSANAENNSQTSQLAFMKDCKIVKQRAMTKDELAAHQQLEAMSTQMKNFELPMKDFELAMKKHELAMKQLGEPVVEHKDGKIVIDQSKIAQQQLIASDIEKLVAQYQPNIDQLTEQGEKIGQAADRFTGHIKANEPGLDYDNIQVLDEKHSQIHCGVYTL